MGLVLVMLGCAILEPVTMTSVTSPASELLGAGGESAAKVLGPASSRAAPKLLLNLSVQLGFADLAAIVMTSLHLWPTLCRRRWKNLNLTRVRFGRVREPRSARR